MDFWKNCPAVEQESSKLSGAIVFKGTRVPVSALFDNMADGARLSEFIEWFQGVSLNQAQTVLRYSAQKLAA